jgi:hypothetical protein
MANFPALLTRITLGSALAALSHAQVSPNWIPTFGEHPGASSPVRCLAAVRRPGPQSQPLLVAGANFLGGQPSAWVSGWDGARWQALAETTAPQLRAAINHDFGAGRELVVAGSFADIGGVQANQLARFDGTQWRAMGNGMFGTVNSLASFAGSPGSAPSVYAGGYMIGSFSQGTLALRRFDGASWVSVGGGLNGAVEVLKVLDLGAGPRLVVGGSFTSAANVPNTRGVAVWDGTSWSALGAGIAGTVYDVELHDEGSGPRLFAAGNFLNSGAPFVTGVARFNSGTWEDVGYGVGGTAFALESYTSGGTSSLYVGGNFTTAGLITASRLARWDGTQWHDLGGANSIVRCMERFDPGDGSGEKLCIGGDFGAVAGVSRQFLALYDGSQWSSAGQGLAGAARCSTFWDGGTGGAEELYVGGEIDAQFTTGRGQVQRWNGSQWVSAGFGTNGIVYALQPFDDGSGPALYAAGDFSSAGGVAANGIARLRQGVWEPVGSGLNGFDRGLALEVFDSGNGPQLHVGGDNGLIPGAPGHCVGRWTGSQWVALPSQTTGSVWALKSLDVGSGPRLFVGGIFSSLGGVSSRAIVQWNGTSFAAVGSGVTSICWGLDSFRFPGATNDELIVTGNLSSASGVPVSKVAAWNGTSFRALSSQAFQADAFGARGFDDGTGVGERLVVHGEFTSVGGVPAPGLAVLDGTQFVPLAPVTARTDPYGSVISTAIWTTPGEPDRLVTAGSFHSSPSCDSYVALWGIPTGTVESYCSAGTSTNGCQALLSAVGVAQVNPSSPLKKSCGGIPRPEGPWRRRPIPSRIHLDSPPVGLLALTLPGRNPARSTSSTDC